MNQRWFVAHAIILPTKRGLSRIQMVAREFKSIIVTNPAPAGDEKEYGERLPSDEPAILPSAFLKGRGPTGI